MKCTAVFLKAIVLCLAAVGVSAGRRRSAARLPTGWATKPAIRTVATRGENHNSNHSTDATGMSRGGACPDTTPVLLGKIAAKTAAESLSLWGILLAGPWASARFAAETTRTIPTVLGESVFDLLVSVVVVFASSFVGALVDGGLSAATAQTLRPTEVVGDPMWYANLEKPAWTPPGWVFPIMWLVVSKPTQLSALSRIFKYAYPSNPRSARVALAAYTTHLALGNAWNKVFFGLECIGVGTFAITLFFAALLTSAYLFYKLDNGAGYYMLPTCGWVAVATSLQYSIYARNSNKKRN